MKEWYSSQVLAGIPGLPSTERRVREKAKREGWRSRKRKKGKGLEYHLSSLPEKVIEHLKAQEAQAALESTEAGAQEGRKLKIAAVIDAAAVRSNLERGAAQVALLTGKALSRVDAREAVLAAVKRYARDSGKTFHQAATAFALLYNEGEFQDIAWVKEHLPIKALCAATIYRWRRSKRLAGAGRLAGSYGNRKGTGRIDAQDELQHFILSMLYDHPHCTAVTLEAGIQARFHDRTDIQIPQLRAIQRWIKDWRRQHPELFTVVSNPDAWKSRFMAAFGRADATIERLNQLWEMDSTPADVMLLDGRHSIIGVIDVFSRRLKLHVSKTSKSAAIAHLVRRSLLEWGAPESIKTDNGQDYTSQYLQRLFRALEIAQQITNLFSPWEKPHIERAFRTFAHALVELLPGYIGHDVKDREAIRARKAFADRLFKKDAVVEIRLSSADLQAFADRWIDDVYQHHAHAGLDGQTPFQAVAAWTGEVRMIADETALDVLLSPAPDGGYRVVRKKGIQLDNDYYIATELGAEEVMGKRVLVLYDPEDLGKVRVFDGEDHRFICVAECPERTGISRQEVAVKARERQKERIQGAKKALKEAASQAKTKEIVEEILAHRAKQADNLVAFPSRGTTPHTTPALEAAAQAARGHEEPEEQVITREQWAEIREQVRDITRRGAVRPEPDFASPFQRAFWIYEEALKGREPNDEELWYLNWYRTETPKSAKNLDDLLRDKHGEAYMELRNRLATQAAGK